MRPENLESIYRLSPAQEGILFHALDEPENALYVRQLVVELSGTLAVERLREAWESLLARHAVLRTSFHWQEVAHPVQVVARRVALPWEERDWRGLSRQERQRAMAELLAADLTRGFDLAHPPLLRLTLVRTGEESWELIWSFHHLILDGWSLLLLLREVFAVFAGLCQGCRPAVLRTVPYKDFITWQERRDGAAAERFWRQTLAGFPAPTPLPGGRPRAAGSGRRRSYAERGVELSAATTAALEGLAQRHGLTVNTLVQGAWALLLARYGQEGDVVFGTTVSGRLAPLPGIESMVGLLINTLPLRVRVEESAALLPWLSELQESASELLQHEHEPLASIQGWSELPRGLPLFDSIVVFQNLPIEQILDREFVGSIPLRLSIRRGAEPMNYPLALIVFEGERLALKLSFERERVEAPAALRLLGHLRSLLDGIAAMAARPGATLAELALLSAAERQQLLVEWNSAPAVPTAAGSLTSRFAAVTGERPEAVAVVGDGAHLSYGELLARSRRLARRLSGTGVMPGERVGLLFERSPEMVVAILGVLAAGAAYVPLDPAHPEERRSFILGDSGARIVVTDGTLVGMERAEEHEAAPGPDDLAYLLYTSGSTGRPKGVGVTHGNVLRLLTSTASDFGLGPDDVWTLFHSYAFDFSVWELWGALAFGGRLAVVPWAVSRTPEAFRELLLREGVTVLNQTPSAFGQLVGVEEAERELSALRLVIFGGEALEPRLLEPWLGRYGEERPRLVNMYGITETTVHVTLCRVGRSDVGDVGAGSRIGRPIADLTVYLLAGGSEPVPVGVAGEIFVGGAGVSQGYPGRAELTAERFVPDPFGGSPGARLYRSGDLARYLPDGDLEYLGRMDHQVKVRGFRIELGEIEQALASCSGVADAAVVLRRNLPGGDGLVAYVVPEAGAELSGPALREQLKTRLPDYMVPVQAVLLPTLPLTANGKLDRKWLAEHGPLSGERAAVSEPERQRPRTPAEELLAAIFAQVLAVEEVGAEGDFFALGGHSLLATQLLSRVREAFRVELPMRAIFEQPTVAGLAREIEKRAGTSGPEAPPLVRVDRAGDLPLSFAQERLWFLDQLEGGPLYNVPVALRMSGELSPALLARVFEEIVRRHEVLRTVFSGEGGEVRQVILPPAGFALPRIDLTALPAAPRERAAADWMAEEARQPFDLARGPLLSARLFRVGETEHVLLLVLHHIVSDGWSMGLLVKEVSALYTAFAAGRPSPLPELPVQYADYAAWQRSWLAGEVLERELQHWRARLAGAPPVLELPADRPRRAANDRRGETRPLALSPAALSGLRELARGSRATPFMALLGVFAALLARVCGQDDLAVGTPVAGRTHREVEPLIGCFINTLVLRLDLHGDPPFDEILDRARETTLAAFAHPDVPFERLVEELTPERDLAGLPLVQVLLGVQNAPTGVLALPGLDLRVQELATGTAKFDLSFFFTPGANGFAGTIEYDRDRFDGATVERLAGGFSRLLAAAGAAPERRLSALDLLSAAERHQITREWSDGETAWYGWAPAGTTAVQIFTAQAARAPEATAVVCGEETLSYVELHRRANRLAGWLRRAGVGPEARVGVLLERSCDLVVALLGIWKAGGAYVPLDPSFPAERLAWTAGDAGLSALLTEMRLAGAVPVAAGLPVLVLDRERPGLALESADEPPLRASADNPAYVLYTSGSTGRPKAVVIPHGALVNLLAAIRERPGMTAADTVLAVTTISFDMAVVDLLLPLAVGARVILARREEAGDGAALMRLIERWSVDVVQVTPVTWQLLLGSVGRRGQGLGAVRGLAGGEALAPDLAADLTVATRSFWNLYGPTEITVYATAGPVDGGPPVSIGRPIANARVVLLDRTGRLTPLGSAGHLHVGGLGLARGYLDRPDLTAERFVPDPTGAAPGARLYATGDLARFLADGRLDYLGRIDHQVKLRGYRIELGEIEAVMRQLPGVREAAVVLLAGRGGAEDRRLAAAYTKADGDAPAAGELRAFLARRLPPYMVPSQLAALAALPQTSSGKVDRRALAALLASASEGERQEAYVPPRGPAEELLAAIWEEVLTRERVGGEDSFFALGGHSLLATRLVSRVRAAFGVELPLKAVFEHPTVAGLAREVETASRRSADAAPPLTRVDRESDLPLSFAQQRLWFIDQLEGGSLYNLPVALSLSGELSIAALSRALREVVSRHEVLRTVFSGDGGEARQVILPPAGFALPLVDLAALPAALRERVATDRIAEQALRPFDLARGPLLRAVLWRLEETEHRLLLAFHHIAGDGWSMGVLVKEVTALYPAFVAGQPSPLPELPVQYADFAAWQRSWLAGEVLEGEIRYWRDRLSGAPPVLELPTDRPRPAVQSFRGAMRPLSLSPELSRALAALSRKEGATLFMTLLSALGVLLSRYTGQADLTLGTAVAGRHRLEIEGLIGFFVNTLVLRPDLSGEPRFRELLSRVRREALDAYAHQDLPFEKLVEELAPERSLAHSPLFQVMFAWQNATVGDLALPGLRLAPLELADEAAKFDLHLSLQETGGRIAGSLSYARDLFDGSTIDRLIAAFSVLLQAVVEGPELPVAQLSLLTPSERHQLLVEWNATSTRWPSDRTLPELFARVAAAHPERLAWEFGAEELSYEDLAGRSDAVARFLVRQGVGAGDVVGLCCERSGAVLVAVLGILKAGAAYLPLDPDYPRERLAWMVEDSGAPLLLTQESLASRLPSTAARIVRLDTQWEEISGAEAEPATAAGPGDLAYVIYTSGSTGRPKGVAVPHRAVVRLVLATDYVDFSVAERVGQLSNLSFDAATFEIWGALLSGATLVGVPRETLLSPADLGAFLGAARIRVLFMTSALFNQVAQQAPGAFAGAQSVLVGGEAVDPGAARRVLTSGAPARLQNGYGPTENTTFSTWYRIEAVAADAATVPIGRPIANSRAYVLDAGLQPVPLGGVGELYVAGAGLALGYWRHPEQTGERFVESPALPGERLYRTGDLVRQLPDGNLDYRGRRDQQVKLRGFRIELGEIELALSGLEGIAEAAVVLREDLPGGRGLAAYVVREGGAEPAAGALRQALESQLPAYMVPACFVELPALPLTPNGKLDRRWLAEHGPLPELPAGASRAPRTAAEELLAGIFAEVLDRASFAVGADDDFFALGGHSLLATQLVSRIRAAFGIELPLKAVFEHPTVAGLAQEVEKASHLGDTAPAIQRVSRAADLPLSFAQQRLWFIDQLEGGSLYNVPVALSLSGDLSVAALSRALREVVSRHEVLRTVFAGEGGETRQVILPPAAFALPLVDLTALPPALRQPAAADRIAEEVLRPFDLARGPLLRVRLWRLDATEHRLLLAFHHIVGDGWSMGVLVREVSALYTAFVAGQPSPLPELPVQYADFAAWQRSWLVGEVLEGEIRHWRDRLSDAPPVLELPTDRPRPAVQSFRGAVRLLSLSPELSRALAALSRKEGATLFMALLSALGALLSRFTGQDDLTLGTVVAGRHRLEIEDLIGFFVNTLVLRPDLSGEPRFRDLLTRVRREALDAYAHQDLPFEKLVEELAPERSLAHSPLFQVMFAWQNAANLGVVDLALPGLRLVPLELADEVAKFDLNLSLAETGGRIAGALSYARDLFDASTIDRWITAFSVLLQAAVDGPELPIAQLSLLTPSERHQLLVEWNDTVQDVPEATLYELFAQQAARHPGAPAVVFREECLTYSALLRRARRLARHLHALGIAPEEPVALYLQRSPAAVVAILGVLAAGGAYMPFDTGHPRERVAALWENAGRPLLLTERSLLPTLAVPEARVLCLDEAEPDDAGAFSPPAFRVDPGSLAYVLHTSGSTGVPKGVSCTHRGVVNLLADFARRAPLAAGSRGSLWTSLSFDVSVYEIFSPLLAGGALHVVPEEVRQETDLFVDWLATERIDSAYVPPFMVAALLARLEAAPDAIPLRRLLVGVEPIAESHLARIAELRPGLAVVNGYGPTETTICATLYDVDRQRRRSRDAEMAPIGRPAANAALYLLDRELQPAPLGVAGELYVGGAGVARGYLRQPRMTAERFVPNPWSAAGGERLYRTGDLVRLAPDGHLEFLGRTDRQIKLRGFRIELGEVEAALAAEPRVGDVAVVLREGLAGGRGLVAYVAPAPGAELSGTALLERLRKRLPAYMVPARVVLLEALPLTPGGKLDRRWLAERGPLPGGADLPAGASGGASRTPVEELLAGMFAAVLGVEEVGAEADFFALGGHSLLATQLFSRLRSAFGVELPLKAIFEHPTVAGLAQEVEKASRLGEASPTQAPPPLTRVDRDGDLPLSFAQQRLWFFDQLEGGALYNVPMALAMRGELSVAVLSRAFGEVVSRHEVLRTVFAGDGGQARQVIQPPSAGFALPLVDLTALPSDLREPAAAERMAEEAGRPFDLARGPLLRARLFKIGEREHTLLLALHHIVSDGWSLGVLLREVSALYPALAAGQPSPLPELPLQYADFAAWQRSWLAGEVLEAEIQYWRDRLSGAPPFLELPTDRPRPAVQSFRGAARPLSLPPELSQAVAALSRREGATLFMTLVAALGVLLSRFSGQADLTLGTVVAGRHRLEIEGLIGFFVNTLVLRPELSGEPRFAELLTRVRREALEAHAHQDLPFEKLVEELAPERSLARSPLFQVMFAWQNAVNPALVELALPGLCLVPLELAEEVAKFDLTLTLAETGSRIAGHLSYARDLFDPSTIDRLAGAFSVLLQAAVERPALSVGQLPLLGPAERQQLLVEWNDRERPRLAEPLVHERFAAAAALRPDWTAVEGDEGRLTYGALEVRANQWAHRLRSFGVGPEVRVALCTERTLARVIGIVAVLKAGGAYVSLDPAYPRERLAYQLADAGAPVVLTQRGLLDRLPETSATVLCLDEELSAEEWEVEAPRVRVEPENLAYVVYTSGSTGRPKGVEIPHAGLLNLVRWHQELYGVTWEDHGTQVASPAFDASIWELWPYLSAGASLYIPDEETRLSAPGMVRWWSERGITLAYLMTPLAEGVLEEEPSTGLDLKVRALIIGGDRLHRGPRPGVGFRLMNHYGPAEYTVTSTVVEVPPSMSPTLREGTQLPSIGRPVDNTWIYVLDRSLEPVPVGVPGELYVAGIGLARGYLGRPELTAEKFLPDPFAAEPGSRFYRTGDLVRYRADGEIDFLGRLDHQVKVRGLRIELGEIEAVLGQHPSVREQAVLVREDRPGDRRLVAYVVGSGGALPGVEELKGYLKERLPDYMVPAAFVELPELPLTANGKVDRRALPAPEWLPESEYAAPRTPVEEIVAGMFAEVLGRERVGVEDDFFALGGHSLLATRLASQVRAAFGRELPLKAIFEAPTVAALAASLEKLGGESEGRPPLERAPRTGALPLSFAQQRLWLLDQMEPGSAAYDIPLAVGLDGPLAVPVLLASFDEIARRHEALRTRVELVAGEPAQAIDPAGSVPVARIDLANLPGALAESEARRLAAAEALRPFDLARGGLLRLHLLRLGEERHLLLVTLHHLVSDGWSTGVLSRELGALYEAFSAGRPSPLPELPIQYGDFAVWQRRWLSGEVLEGELAHWRERLSGAPTLELATDLARPAVQTFRGRTFFFHLPAGLSAALPGLALRRGATLFMALLAAFEALLHRYSGQTDFTLGTPIAGRNRRETEPLIGFFVNNLVVRADVAGEPSSSELLSRVREWMLAAYAHQDLPFERLVEALQLERDLSRSPLFQVVFALQNVPVVPVALTGLESSPLGLPGETAKFDLTLVLQEEGGSLSGGFEYNRDLFEEVTVRRMAGHFGILLSGLLAAPEGRISQVALLSAAERAQLLREWNDLVRPRPAEPLVHELFAAAAALRPDWTAVEGDEGRLTYGALEVRANQWAHRLRSFGVGPEVRVALCTERTLARVIGIVAVLKAGGAYVSLDPAYPRERLAYQLADAGAPVVLTQRGLLDRLPETPATVLCLDEELSAEEWEVEAPRVRVEPENLAYVVYTSGSTGRPKGVEIPHAGLLNLVRWHQDLYGVTWEDHGTQVASPAFDASIWELWPYLSAGASLYIPDEETRLSAPGMVRWWSERGITLAYLMTPLAEGVLEEEPSTDLDLKVRALIIGGDRLHRGPRPGVGFRLMNHYGPAEYTVTSTVVEVPPSMSPMSPASREGTQLPSIGRPVDNTWIYVLDRSLEPVPVGVPGELYVAGIGLARGYLGRPDLTAEKFLPDPFAAEPGSRFYRTGDLVRYRVDGEIDFLGRLDHQVKVRGLRIELGEIEAVLGQHPAVREQAVLVREDRPGDRRLVAYVVASGGGALPGAEELKEYLKERLPDYMVPAAFVELGELPLTANGKVDRRALPAPEGSPESEYVAPRTAAEEILAGMFAEVLGRERVGIEDDFFALGGHSLLATRLASQVRAAFGRELPLKAIFEAPTVSALAASLEKLAFGGEGEGRPPLERAPRTGALPLSFAQQRLWLLDQMEPGSPAYNIPLAVVLDGPLAVPALLASFGEIARRHEALRTRVELVAGEPAQGIGPAGPVPMARIDLARLPGPRAESEARRLAAEEALRPFDLARGGLLRLGLLRLGAERHVLLVTMHHIVSDGWSTGVLIRELGILYEAFSAGRPSPLPELPIQYGDFAVWQRRWLAGEVLEGELAHWRERLSGAPTLELATDLARPAVQTFRGRTHFFRLPAGLSSALPALALRRGATLFMTLLAAFEALLHRYSGQTDFTLGTPIAGRNRRETEPLIGFFVNNLVVRADLAGEPSLSELLTRVREWMLAAYAHQDLPFERLVEGMQLERDLSRSPLFQVVFALQNVPTVPVALEGLGSSPLGLPGETAKFDLTLALQEEEGSLAGGFEYNRDLFEEVTVRRMAAHFGILLSGLLAAPEGRISQVALLSAAERAQLLHEWNDLVRPRPAEPLVHELFAAAAALRPASTAVEGDEGRLTYGVLETRANQWAHRLRSFGVGPEVRVALCTERTLARVIGIVAVLKAGGAYVSLDPAYPRERLAYQLEDAGAPVVLTERGLLDRLPETSATVLCLDEELSAEEWEVEAPRVRVEPENLAYVVYTSGSTGRPKGVEIPHAGLLNLVRWHQELYGVTFEDHGTQVASPAFDASIWELWPYLSAGASLYIPDEETRLSAPGMVRWWSERGITLAYLMTPLAEGVLEEEPSTDLDLRVRALIIGGDRLHRGPRPGVGFRLMNHYGPAEYTVTSTVVEVPPSMSPTSPTSREGAQLPSIGRPVDNTWIYVLDRSLEPVPVGVPGELYVAGIGLARGYLGRPDLTAEKFLPDPFAAEPGSRFYRTGDLVRYRADGEIDFLGRLDHQVKVRGLRIELGEIEAVLGQHPAVREQAVLVREDRPGDRRLVAYVVVSGAGLPGVEELKGYLKERLPDYMVPAAFVELSELPLTANGKVDRRALPAPEGSSESRYVAPRTPVEEILAGIWAEMLGLARVGPDDNFFEIGGHSLIGARLLARLREAFAVELHLRALFATPTVAGLAAEIERLRRGAGAPALPTISSFRHDRGAPPPLSFAQLRYWTGRHLEARSVASTGPMLLHFAGPFDPVCLQRAIAAVVERHELLRTSFRETPEGPIQVIHPTVPLAFPEVDLERLTPAQQRAEVERYSVLDGRLSFDYERAPMFRQTFFRCAAEEHMLLFTVHHVASDWWSNTVLIREVSALYLAFRAGQPSPLPPLVAQFQDFARWQRRLSLEEAEVSQVTFWREHLAGAVPVDLCAGRPRPRQRTYTAGSVDVWVPGELERQLDTLAARHGVTMFMTLLAAFYALLHLETGQDDLVIPCSFANRNQLETELLIGNLATGLPLRTRLAGLRTFRELLYRVRDVTLLAHDHPDIFWEPVVEGMDFLEEGDKGGLTTFRILFLLVKLPPSAQAAADLLITQLPVDTGKIRLDLSLRLTQGERLGGRFRYSRDLLDEARVLALRDRYLRILAAVVADPECPMAELLRAEPAPREPAPRDLALLSAAPEAGIGRPAM